MDEHVPKPVTVGLRLRGVDVLTTQGDGNAGLPDPELLDRATALGRLLFTQDHDFLAEADRRLKQAIPFAGVVYCHQHRLSIGQVIDALELIAKCGEPSEFVNTVNYLP